MIGTGPAVVVDTFTGPSCRGNQAAVVLLDPAAEPPSDATMQEVAAGLGMTETVFVGPRGDGSWHLRWFTPAAEVRLGGHGTLAAAHVLFGRGLVPRTGGARITFRTYSGDLAATTGADGRIVLDLPIRPAADRTPLPEAGRVLGVGHRWVGTTVGPDRSERNGLARVAPRDLLALEPDLDLLATLPLGGLIVTARPDPADRAYDGVDVLSRYFAPAFGLPEDPVTASAHCTLVDYWTDELDRDLLRCRQVSARGGDLLVSHGGGRAFVAGHAVTAGEADLAG